jgi:hypothetical protein
VFRGGIESLFDNKKSWPIEISHELIPGKPTTISDLLQWIKKVLIKERYDLFMTGESV